MTMKLCTIKIMSDMLNKLLKDGDKYNKRIIIGFFFIFGISKDKSEYCLT